MSSWRLFALLLIVPLGCIHGAAAASRTVVDAVGRHVDVPMTISRVLPAGPPASVVLFALVPDKMAGWIQTLSPAQLGFIPARYATLPAVGRLTARGDGNPSDLVRAAHPDLIVDIGDVDSRYAALADKVQAETGVPYLLLSGSLSAIGETLRTLGPILGAGPDGERLADYVDAALAEAGKAASRVPAEKHPAVYFARGADGLQTPMAPNGPAEFLTLLGARNITATADAHGVATVTFDQVRAWRPDYIVTDEAEAYATITHDAKWHALDAVQAGRVLLAPSGPFGWMDHPPSFNRVMGLRWLARGLYPSEFKDDLRQATTTFYRIAYHQEPSAAQLDELLQAGSIRR